MIYQQFNMIPKCLGMVRHSAYFQLGSRCLHQFNCVSTPSLNNSRTNLLRKNVYLSPNLQWRMPSFSTNHIIHESRPNEQNILKMPWRCSHGMGGGHEKPVTWEHSKQHREQQDAHNEDIADSAWIARLANENGYLSWCRNSYLATALSLAMFAGGNSLAAEYAAYGIIAIAITNHLGGTLSYIYYTLSLRKRVQMASLTATVHVVFVIMHFLCWLSFVLLFANSLEEEKEREAEEKKREAEEKEH